MLQPTNTMITNATKLLPNGTYLLQWPGYQSLQVTVERGASTGGTPRKKKGCVCSAPSGSQQVYYAEQAYTIDKSLLPLARRIIAAGNDEGTIQANVARKLFGDSNPRLHTTTSVDSALRAIGAQVSDVGAIRSKKVPGVSAQVREEIQQRIVDWRFAVKQFLAGYRRGVAPAERDRLRNDLWNASVNLLGSMGIDIRNWSPSGQLIAESDVWWARQADFVNGPASPLMDALAALTSSAASKLSASAKNGQIDEQVVTLFLSVLLKLMQVEGKLAMRHVQPKSTKTDPCRVPKKRTGPEAKCNADWDGIVSCVIRSGGLSASDPAVAELVHAAGRRKDLPPKLIQKRGKPWGQIAHVLTEQGFTAPDQHGRPDEQATLETLVEALRGGPRMARMNLCQAERSLHEEV